MLEVSCNDVQSLGIALASFSLIFDYADTHANIDGKLSTSI